MPENFKTFNIALDVKQELFVDKFTIYEGDTGNRFVITLTDDGTAVDLTDCRVAVVFSGAMGTAMQDSWTGTGDVSISGASHNVVTVDVHTGAYANGLNTCEVQVYSGASYTTLITSAFFTFQGEKPILDDETIQAAEAYPTLVYWAGKVEDLTDREQSDWTQTDDTKGNFIQHKPVAGTDYINAIPNLTAETTLATSDKLVFLDDSATTTDKHRSTTVENFFRKIFGSITGLIKADGAGNISAAVANTDYAAAEHKTRHYYGAADAVPPANIGQYGVAELGSDGKVLNSNTALIYQTKSGNYSLVAGDEHKITQFTATANCTIPASTFAVGVIVPICNSSGTLTVVAGSGVTLVKVGGYASAAANAAISLLHLDGVGTETWLVVGTTS